jgi:hypothetical protein
MSVITPMNYGFYVYLRSGASSFRRGASTDDLNSAMRGNFLFLLFLIAMSAGAAALRGAVIGLITPAFSIVIGTTAYSYLIIGLVANAAIIAVFGIYI